MRWRDTQRKQFTFYESFYQALRRIKKKQDRVDAYDAIAAYALYGTEPDYEKLPDSAAIAFDLIRPTLDSSRRKSENGKSGGCAKKGVSKPEANRKQNESKPEANRKGGECVSEKEGEVENEVEVENENECYMTPPTPSPKGGAEKNYWGFDQFWDVYPKKSAKADAFEAWKRVDPDEALVGRILEAVRMQKLWPQYSGENRRFFPTPAKWLDGGCWDDEPTEGEEDPYAKFT